MTNGIGFHEYIDLFMEVFGYNDVTTYSGFKAKLEEFISENDLHDTLIPEELIKIGRSIYKAEDI